jgi:hypothetical protein
MRSTEPPRGRVAVHPVRWMRSPVALLLAMGLLAVGSIIDVRLVFAATAYEAKMLCSEVFVAGLTYPIEQPGMLQAESPFKSP